MSNWEENILGPNRDGNFKVVSNKESSLYEHEHFLLTIVLISHLQAKLVLSLPLFLMLWLLLSFVSCGPCSVLLVCPIFVMEPQEAPGTVLLLG
jgi:hypothetical protein